MFTMLNRMCWNSRGWRLPTKSSEDGGYPGKMGFGHEEWNFQIEDAVEGFVYGYLYSTPSKRVIKQAEGHFRIGFWGLEPKTNQRLLVGLYNNAQLSTPEDMRIVDRAFSSRGIYQRRAEELFEVVDTLNDLDCLEEVINSVQEHWLNFKCPVEEVKHLQRYFPVSHFLKSKNLGLRFTKPTYINPEELSTFPVTKFEIEENEPKTKGSGILLEDAYYRESKEKLKRIEPRHNKLSNSFAEWLQGQGYQNISQEINYVDVTFSKDGVSFLAELKVCYGVGSTKAIREALGQLFEYNFYGNREPADYWLIVLDEQASESDIEYIRKLRTEFSLPIYLCWKGKDAFYFPIRVQ